MEIKKTKIIENPLELLSYKRFDLIPKIVYGFHRKMNIKSDWSRRLYEAHIMVFNGGYEVYPVKKGMKKFLEEFDKVLDSIERKGFDESKPISVSKEGIIIDGSHRFAAGLVNGKKIHCNVENKKGPNYDSYYFRDKIRYVPDGLQEKWSDAIALEYCKLKKNTYIVTIFPSAISKHEEIIKAINKRGRVVYEKKIFIRNQGPLNLMRQMYDDQKWLGNLVNNFKGGQIKAMNCFVNKGPVRIFLIESKDLDRVNKIKNEIRDIFKIGNHSVHINDSHDYTVKLAQIFFNENSIHFLNNARLKNLKTFYSLLREYKRWLEDNNYDKEHFCIDGSSILSIYGLRDVNDLDFLSRSFIDSPNNKINCHNKDLEYEKEIDDLIFNPENHFYFDGLKFISLGILKEIKAKRNELKDKIDLELIEGMDEDFFAMGQDKESIRARIVRTYAFQKLNYVFNRVHSLFAPFLNRL